MLGPGVLNWWSEGIVTRGSAQETFTFLTILIICAFIGDMIYRNMVEEFKYKTFEIILLSRVSVKQILLSKILLPIIIGSVIGIFSMGINDLFGAVA